MHREIRLKTFMVMILSLVWGSTVAQETGYEWTWIGGSNSTRTSVFGTQGVPDAQNIPGGGKTDMYTTDQNGNFWLYGGGSGSSVLWKNDGTGWAWMAGTSTDITGSGFYPNPVYGTKGVADPANRPSVRSGGTMVADSQGNIWLFGGYGEDSSGNLNITLNDLWKFDGTNWTWISGSNLGHQPAVYGTKGVADPLNVPGTRSGHVMWVDNQDNIWIFGGDGWATTTPNGGTANRLNDLWKFDGTNWTWMSGNNGYFQQGVYGTKGVADPINTPGARYGADGWTDANGDLYLFGGTSHGQVSATGSTSSLRPINDLWKFDGSNWTWVKGADTLLSEGVYGTKGIADPANNPSARTYFSLAKASNGDVYVYAGYGIDSNGAFYNELSDVWKFDGLNWTWVSGPSTGLEAPNFGTLGVLSESNSPGSRHSAAIWMRNNEAFVFGGKSNYGSPYPVFGLNDFWRLTEASQETELIAHFKFSGNSADSSLNSYDLVANDNPELTSDRGGVANSAYLFDGENDFFTTQDGTPFELQNFTYSMWINPFAFALPNKTATFISTQENFETTGFYSFINVDGRIGTYVNDGNSLIGFLGQFLNIGEWVHYAFTYDGNRLQTYVNAQPTEGLDLGVTIMYNGSSPLTIGGNSRPENDFNGKMDEILVYNQALSATEIDSIYNSQVPDVFDNTSQWSSTITTTMNGKSSSAVFGTTPTSTDGFDPALDIPLPPAPNGDYVQLFFAHPEFGGTLGDNYRSDFKAYSNYETSNSSWELSLYSTFAGSDTLFFSRPEGFLAPIKVIDENGVEFISLAGDLEVLYTISAGETQLFDIVVGDIFPPSIELAEIMDGPQIWDKTLSRALNWTVTDPSGITNITTEVSYDGGTNWSVIYSGLDAGFSFVPDASITLNESTLFRVSATDGASTNFTNSATVSGEKFITIVAPTQSLDFTIGWQMVGSPFANEIDPTSEISDAIRYRWNTSSFEYLLTETYPSREGIWLGAYQNDTDVLTGEIGESDTTITVRAGWNMATSPLFRNVTVDSISVFDGITNTTFDDAVSNFLITSPQGYNGIGYEVVDTLEFFSSYWLGVTVDSLVLTLPIHEFEPQISNPKIAPIAQSSETVNNLLLTIIDGEFEQELMVRLGGNPSQPAPPPAPNRYKVGFVGESTILGNLYTMITLNEEDIEGVEIPFLLDGPERELTLRWTKQGFDGIPISIKTQDNLSLEGENGEFQISSTDFNTSKLAIGELVVASEREDLVPTKFGLAQNYPNPFNPSTNISFALPQRELVTLEVFSITGQKVGMLVNETLSAGNHTIQFDASGLSSGTYIYRIQAGDFVQTRKMVLVK